jgi:hypothetical protein
MNPIASPIASPIPSGRSTVTPFQSALAAQIGALTHTVDALELVANSLDNNDLEEQIDQIHSTIDALNGLYESSLNDASENRRAKWLLRDILRDLPVNKDWLNPDTERNARELVGN